MDRLDKIKKRTEVVRITTGCISISHLKKECGWETLADRRFKHRIILFYKMRNGLVSAAPASPCYSSPVGQSPSRRVEQHPHETD